MSKYEILVVSDTHGDTARLNRLLPIINSSSHFIHLGDGGDDLRKLDGLTNPNTIIVKGNCDRQSNFSDSVVERVGDVKFFITHGHLYGASYGNLISLAYKAEEERCRFALFGHTHIPCVKDVNGITLVNPGSLSLPRVGAPSYAIITGDGTKFNVKIVDCKP